MGITRLTNLISNGSFEVNTTGWEGFNTNQNNAQSTLAIGRVSKNLASQNHGEYGDWCARLGVKAQGVLYLNPTTSYAPTNGNKYYIRALVSLRSDMASVCSGCVIMNGVDTSNTNVIPIRGATLNTPLTDGLLSLDTTQFTLIDAIWTANVPWLRLRTVFQTTQNQGNNDQSGRLDNIMLIDLTSSFGTGLEPTLMAIRQAILDNPVATNGGMGYFEGFVDIDVPLAPVFSTQSIPTGLNGKSYSTTIVMTNGFGTQPFSFSLSGLPTGHGLTINNSGQISGTLNLPGGNYNLTVNVVDKFGYSVSKTYNLVVGEPPFIVSEYIDGPILNTSYSWTPTVTGTQPINVSMVVSSGSLPTGLSIIGDTISGTPTVDGQFCSITITASNTYDPIGVTKILELGVFSLPRINTISPLSNGILNSSYSLQLSSSGVPPFEWTILSGNLPNGLSLSLGGLISGTPTQTGVFQFSIQAENTFGTDVRLFMLSVYELPVITTNDLGYARLSTVFSTQLTATGTQPITFEIFSGSLPPGLSLNQNTGVISGTALSSGSYTVTIIARNSGGYSSTRTYILESGLRFAIITPSPLRVGTVNVPYGNFSFVTDGADSTFTTTWALQSGTIPPGMTYNTTTNVLSGTPSTAGIYNFAIRATNNVSISTVQYQLEIGSPPKIITPPDIGGGVDRPFTIILQSDSIHPTTWAFTVPPIAGVDIQLLSNGALYWLIPVVGNYYFTIKVTNQFGDSVPVQFHLEITTPSITDVYLPVGVVGSSYTYTFSASGNPPFTWSMPSGTLPPGLTWNASTATISGTPTIIGTYNFEIRAENIGGFSQEPFYIDVYTRPIITNASLSNGNETIYYSQTLLASGTTPITFSIISGSLPTGLSLSGNTISGFPSSQGSFTFTVRAENLLGSSYYDDKQFNINIGPSGSPIITNNPNLLAVKGVAYSLTLTATNNPIDFLLDSGSTLPPGLGLSGGVIYGTPTTPGIYTFWIMTWNGVGADARQFSMTVGDPPVITTTSLSGGTVNHSYIENLSVTGDTPITWTIQSGSLPPGLSIVYGVIKGTPTTPGTYNFQLRATNSSGYDQKSFSITIITVSGTWLRGKKVGSLFVKGKKIGLAFVKGKKIYDSGA